MTQYKFITGPDDSKFCARITEFLNNGWKLYGNPTMSFDGKTVVVNGNGAFIQIILSMRNEGFAAWKCRKLQGCMGTVACCKSI